MTINAVQRLDVDEGYPSHIVAALINGGAALLVGMAAARHWPDLDAGTCAALVWCALTAFVAPLRQLDRQNESTNE